MANFVNQSQPRLNGEANPAFQPSPRGVIFDMDGVVLQSTPCHAEAFDRIFRGIGISDFTYAPYAGWRTRDVVADVLRRRGHECNDKSISALALDKSLFARDLIHCEPNTYRILTCNGWPSVMRAGIYGAFRISVRTPLSSKTNRQRRRVL